MFLLSSLASVLRTEEHLSVFGEGCIKLNDQNIVYLELSDLQSGKVLPFGVFKRNVHYYSELMNTPCVAVLGVVEGRALMNARKGKRARENYTR